MPLDRKPTRAAQTQAHLDTIHHRLEQHITHQHAWGVTLSEELLGLLRQTQALLPRENSRWGRLRWLLTGR